MNLVVWACLNVGQPLSHNNIRRFDLVSFLLVASPVLVSLRPRIHIVKEIQIR